MEFERINVLIEKYLPPPSTVAYRRTSALKWTSRPLSRFSTTLNEFILFAAARVCCQVEESLTCKRNTHWQRLTTPASPYQFTTLWNLFFHIGTRAPAKCFECWLWWILQVTRKEISWPLFIFYTFQPEFFDGGFVTLSRLDWWRIVWCWIQEEIGIRTFYNHPGMTMCRLSKK